MDNSASKSSGVRHYKITKTFTGPDGKKHTETVEMFDDDTVDFMQKLRLRDGNPFEESKPMQRSIKNAMNSTQSASGNQRTREVQDNNEFVREALQVHNQLRQKHGVDALKLNNDLCKLAQDWANHLASKGALVHSKIKYRNEKVGENIYCQSWPMTGKEMTQAWYDECKNYDYNSRHTYQSNCGHFTQVVWKGSQEVGFAKAQGTSMNFAVAMYYPPGNYLGEFNRNVFPPV